MVYTATDLRPSGIPVLGQMPWGTHFCQFYQTKDHLREVLVPYFQKGLENNEFCVWVTSESVTVEEAREALSAVVPDLAEREAKGQFEVFPYTDWYLVGGCFDMKRILDGWAEKYRQGLQRGFVGLRVSGDTAWLESEHWESFCQYEHSIDSAIEGSNILVLCTYSLDRCGPYELLDVVRNHQFALILGQRGWERIENAELARLRELQQESQEQLRQTAEKIRHQNAVLEGINRIFVEAMNCQTEEQLGRACLAVAEAVTESKFGFIGEINTQSRLDDIAISDPGWVACRMDGSTGHRRVPTGFMVHGLYGRVLLDGKGFFTNDPPSHPDSIGTPPGHPPLKAFLGVPLLHAGKTIGMVAVGNREGGYRQEDLAALESLAGAIVQVFMRHRGEQALHQQREWLRVTLTSIGDAVIATDTAARITFLNPVAAALTGWAPEEALGQPVSRVLRTIDENTRQPAVDVVAQVLSEKRTVAMANHTALLTRDGREIPIEDSAAPILDGAANVTGVVLVFHDVTEKRRDQEALVRAKRIAEAASQAKDQFIAALSHELRTPLMPSLAAAGAMLKDARLPEDMREDAAMIQRNIGLEVALINDLLDVTRIANGKLSLHKAPVDVARILREAADICCGDMDAKRQTLTIDMPDAPHPVEADAARLHQVFWNLIKNAIKFTPDRGRIEIKATAGDGSVRITVRDNGIGIDAAVMPRLFAAFEQGEQIGAFGGLGLGLAIAKGVVEAHGGRISVASEGRDKGATFTVELPLLPSDRVLSVMASDSPGRVADDQRTTSRSLRILLVEDHADTARMMTRLLMAEGHDVVAADCIKAALAAADAGPFDVLMSDLGLPDGTGHDLMRQLLDAGKSLKGIAISGYGAAADLQASREAGFAEHITKPVAFDALHQALIRIANDASNSISRERARPRR